MSATASRLLRALKRRGQARLVAAVARSAGAAPKGLRVERLGSSYGGYWVPTALLAEDWLCVSGGVGEDTTFDDELLARAGCTIVAADPTDRAAAHVAARPDDPQGTFAFVPVGLWSEDTIVEFYPPKDPAHVSYSAVNLQDTDEAVRFPALSLPSLLEEAGQDPSPERLDLLKLDIEGSEHRVVADALERGFRPTVICLEIDQPCPLRTALATVRTIQRAGYRLAKADGWTHTWVRRTALPGGPTTSVRQVVDRTPRTVARAATIEAARLVDTVRPGPDEGTARIQHVFWHHVYDDERAGFGAQLDLLAQRYDLISYDESIDRLAEGPIDRPFAAISFDDGLASCVQAGAQLAERGLSGCFFVLGDLVGETDPDVLGRFCRNRLAMPYTEMLTWAQIEALVDQGHQIGSHGMSHRRLSTLSSDEVDDELGRSHDLLVERIGTADHFAWPYGHLADAPADIVSRAKAAGFRSAAANERGCHTRPLVGNEPVRRDHALANWPARQLAWFLDRNLRRIPTP